jgi:hypothetical protein
MMDNAIGQVATQDEITIPIDLKEGAHQTKFPADKGNSIGHLKRAMVGCMAGVCKILLKRNSTRQTWALH